MAPDITTLFWDIGGVILSNGWDEEARARAVQHFGFDEKQFGARHAEIFPAYEAGHLTLAEYLNRTLFAQPQPFSEEEFVSFIYAQSSENTGTRVILDELTAARGYLLAALNNEGRELNNYRIEKFHLDRNFSLFFSSCYLGVTKPDLGIYRMALEVTRRAPAECVFIDDRAANLESAQRLGMRTIHFRTPTQLRADLAQAGVRGAA